jgi:hypothetical protein
MMEMRVGDYNEEARHTQEGGAVESRAVAYHYDKTCEPAEIILNWLSRQGCEGDLSWLRNLLCAILMAAERIREEWAPALQSIKRIEDDPERVLEVVRDMISCVKNLESLCNGCWDALDDIRRFVSRWLPEENSEE